MTEYLSIAATILTAVGGAGAIILGLANYLGRIWADRLMRNEAHQHSLELEAFRRHLQSEADLQLAQISSNYEIFKEAQLKEHGDKLVIYRAAIDIIASTLAKLEMVVLGARPPLSAQEKELFETERLRVYGYLAMLAPQEVMDAHDHLTDILLSVVHRGQSVTWKTIRDAALRLINAMRRDVGLNKSEITYNGTK
jgi:hypothetical protein